MENDAATLYCPNELCQSPNPHTHKFCQRCSTPLPKVYLWAATDAKNLGSPKNILADRYLVISKSILLDTKPGLLPQTPDGEIFHALRPYLRLFPYRLHIPQVYGVLPLVTHGSRQEILLLEKPPIYVEHPSHEVQLCSQLTTIWHEATSIRQLNWLWQIANLWQPLSSQNVGSSLLTPELLRVEGPLIRLLELYPDKQTTPSFLDLGEFWQQLLPGTKPAIAEFVSALCHALIEGKIHSDEQLITILDKGLAAIGKSQTAMIKITTKSDTGPSRQRNEDACYPPSGVTITKPPHPTAFAIVCDGIGGHEGGSVASTLAIETIQQQVQELTKVPYDHLDPVIVLADLEQAAAAANDKISQRNDSEHRQGRQRMGTTLVMALPLAHEMYIAHVGDSRAYWISRHNCHQVTLDDDVASREVRLGYAIYRDAVQQSASGSLVQALGMASSHALHPTAQRFILDEDSVFLLCSDGLSDFDRIEQNWDTEILPILTDQLSIAQATDKLIEIANNQNGHDNVTIAIVHYQVKYSEPKSPLTSVLTDLSAVSVTKRPSKEAPISQNTGLNQKTQVLTEKRVIKSPKVPFQLILLLGLIVGGSVLGFLWGRQGLWILEEKTSDSVPTFATSSPTATFDPSGPSSVSNSESPAVASGRVIQTTSEIIFDRTPPLTATNAKGRAPKDSVLQIISLKQEPAEQQSDQNTWVYLRVCSIGQSQSPTASPPLLQLGEEVRIPFSKFKSLDIPPIQSGITTSCSTPVKTKPAPNPGRER